MITKRSIGVAILLSIVTCGIYGIYWMVVVTDDTNKAINDPNGTSGGIAVLLSIVTCGIYGIYWLINKGKNLIMQRICVVFHHQILIFFT